MNKFVKEQKVICKDTAGNSYLTLNKIYTIKYVIDYEIIILNDAGFEIRYNNSLFKTIIQDTDDVISGMVVTYLGRRYSVWGFMPGISDQYVVIALQVYGGTEKTFVFIEDLEEYKPKKKENKMCIKDLDFEIVKPFSISDIYRNRPDQCTKWQKEFQGLLDEEYHTTLSLTKPQIITSKALRENLDWLEEKGFIKTKVKHIPLKSGMRVREKDGKIWTLIDDQNRNFYLTDGFYLFNHNNSPLYFHVGDTTDVFKYYSQYGFEVVNE